MPHSEIIQLTKCWLKSIIIDLNFCPFANQEFIKDRIRYAVCDHIELEPCLHHLAEELQYLDKNPDIETTLVIFPAAFKEFEAFLDLIDIANRLLEDLGYISVYQLAHFHPDYCFDGVETSDASNYTNRAPFPILHLLREDSLEIAISKHPAAEKIPDTNIMLARKMGVDKIQSLLDKCMPQDK